MIGYLLFCVILVLFVTLYSLSTKKYDYWKTKNVPHLKPKPLLGNYADFMRMKTYMGKLTQKICQTFPNEPYVGVYYGTEPALVILDPEIIKLVTTKDFYYFNGREISYYTDKEPVTRNMFFTYGDRWKVIRQNISPLFTSLKMKKMFPLIQKCAYLFEDLLDRETRISNVLDVKDLMSRYTMDSICSCVFGVDANTMAKNVSIKNNPFRKMSLMIFSDSYIGVYVKIARAIWPAIFYGLGLKMFPKIIFKFFDDLLTNVYKDRNYEPTTRNDFVDMLLNLKKKEYIICESLAPANSDCTKQIKMEMDNDFLVAQSTVMFAAGFETSSSTLIFALYELAKHDEIQARAIDEVDEYLRRHEGRIEYDCVSELPFLEACLDETLRLYPVLGTYVREVMEDYTLPTGLLLEKGLRIHLPIYYLHRCPDFFPEPEEFRPERFLPENKHNIRPYTYMPFGEGPRICIGMGFAKMQMLPGLVAILKKYRLSLADGMPPKVDFTPTSLTTQARGSINLKFQQREGCQQNIFNKDIHERH